jgi:hypothetical protein
VSRKSSGSVRDLKGHGLFAARLVLLGAIAVAALAAGAMAWKGDHALPESRELYRCPMHPAFTARTPGECPLCQMALERVPDDRRPDPRGMLPPVPAIDDAARGEGYAVRPIVFTDNIRAPAWVESPGVLAAHLYLDELSALEPAARGEFSPSRAPRDGVEVRMTAEAATPWDCCTARVRFAVDPRGPMPRPGAAGWLQFASRSRRALVVPSSAVLQSPEGPYVFVPAAASPGWEPRPVRLGKVFSGNAVVLAGVGEHESVAVNGLFFLEAERRLRSERDPGDGPAR